MFDMGAITKVASTLETGVADLDKRLADIAHKLDLLIVITAMSNGSGDTRTILEDAAFYIESLEKKRRYSSQTPEPIFSQAHLMTDAEIAETPWAVVDLQANDDDDGDHSAFTHRDEATV